MIKLAISTHGERFYDVSTHVQHAITEMFSDQRNGAAVLFCPHTSCALTIAEAYDVSARNDMENFLKHLAPRGLNFITHNDEGADDSPSHMKSILLQQSLTVIVNDARVVLGSWQGIYLAEFRDAERRREIWLQSLRA